jgi:hypothetical protein
VNPPKPDPSGFIAWSLGAICLLALILIIFSSEHANAQGTAASQNIFADHPGATVLVLAFLGFNSFASLRAVTVAHEMKQFVIEQLTVGVKGGKMTMRDIALEARYSQETLQSSVSDLSLQVVNYLRGVREATAEYLKAEKTTQTRVTANQETMREILELLRSREDQ